MHIFFSHFFFLRFFPCLVLELHYYLEENHYRSQNTEPGLHESFNPASYEEWVQSHPSRPPQHGKTMPPVTCGSEEESEGKAPWSPKLP